MKNKPSFESIAEKIHDIDTLGFFTAGGTFGLEKRDDLMADVKAVKEEHEALNAVAEAAGQFITVSDIMTCSEDCQCRACKLWRALQALTILRRS